MSHPDPEQIKLRKAINFRRAREMLACPNCESGPLRSGTRECPGCGVALKWVPHSLVLFDNSQDTEEDVQQIVDDLIHDAVSKAVSEPYARAAVQAGYALTKTGTCLDCELMQSCREPGDNVDDVSEPCSRIPQRLGLPPGNVCFARGKWIWERRVK